MTETREAPTPREVVAGRSDNEERDGQIERIRTAIQRTWAPEWPSGEHGPNWLAHALYEGGLRFPVPPDPAVRDNDNAGPEAALNHLREIGGPKRDSGVSARTAAKGMSVSQQAIFESGYAQGRADAITDTLPVPPDPGTAATVTIEVQRLSEHAPDDEGTFEERGPEVTIVLLPEPPA